MLPDRGVSEEYHHCRLWALDIQSHVVPEIRKALEESTLGGSKLFSGFDLGVDVKTGYLSGRRSGETEESVVSERCGVRSRG